MTAPAPGTPEWARLVTASKVAAIIGVSPWDSPRSMWHKMRCDVPSEVHNDATRRGQYLEAGILAWWRDQHPEYTNCQAQYWATRPDLPWAAATPDLRAEGPDVVLVDAKSTSNIDEWGEPGTDLIPTAYLTSSYWQLAMCPEAARVHVAVLGPYLRFEEYVVERDEEIQADLIARCHQFYLSLDADTPPPLDDHVATFEVLHQQRGDIARGERAEIDRSLAAEFLAARHAEDEATARARLADSRVIDAAGNAQYVTCDGVRVARQQVNRRRPVVVATHEALATRSAA